MQRVLLQVLGKMYGEQRMDDYYKKEHTCLACGSIFIIKHEMYDDVIYCPFCGEADIEEDDEE